ERGQCVFGGALLHQRLDRTRIRSWYLHLFEWGTDRPTNSSGVSRGGTGGHRRPNAMSLRSLRFAQTCACGSNVASECD
ncbi:hypothetical protein FOMPIDRAFT_121508, partial [Fomitopsis schrenkii]